WLPNVTTSTPEASNRSARRGVIPAPSATFSPLATQKSTPSSCRRPGSRDSIACRPAVPKMSATKRILTGAGRSAERQRRGRMHLDRHVVPGVLGVARQRLVLDAGDVDDRAEPGAPGDHG